MSNDRFYRNLAPLIPHLAARNKEVGDLRHDIYEALSSIADGLVQPGMCAVLEAVQPPAGEGHTTVRVRVLDAPSGNPVTAPVTLEFAVFDDADGVAWSASGVLESAAQGTILSGAGTPVLKVKTNSTGVFECVLLDPVAHTAYIAAFSTPTGPVITCVGSLGVVFTA